MEPSFFARCASLRTGKSYTYKKRKCISKRHPARPLLLPCGRRRHQCLSARMTTGPDTLIFFILLFPPRRTMGVPLYPSPLAAARESRIQDIHSLNDTEGTCKEEKACAGNIGKACSGEDFRRVFQFASSSHWRAWRRGPSPPHYHCANPGTSDVAGRELHGAST